MKVWAKDESMLKHLKHVPTGKTLGENLADGAEWPDDNFTQRRLRDGDITTTPPKPQQARRDVEVRQEEPKPAKPKSE